MEIGKATEILSSIISIAHITLYLQWYYGIKKVTDRSMHITSTNTLNKKINKRRVDLGCGTRAIKEAFSIVLSLDKLQTDGWIKHSLRFDVTVKLLKQIMNDDRYLLWKHGTNIRQTKNRHRDNAFDVLLYALIHDVKEYTSKPKYKIVCDFLSEQNIEPENRQTKDDEIMEVGNLSKHYKALKFEDICLILYSCSMLGEDDFTIPKDTTHIDPKGFFFAYADYAEDAYKYFEHPKTLPF
jgi:hypothetical protein